MRGRIGLLGGSFDPPHGAHLVMAQTAREALGLERVILLPAPRPPHKKGQELSPFADRLDMARAAVAGVAGVEVSALETERDGPSFTVDTLRACRERYGNDLYFIMGADSLHDLPAWRDPQVILGLCTLVVFPRGETPARLATPGEAALVVFESPRIDVSSTEVRLRIQRGESVRDTLPDGVLELIGDRGLYRQH